MNKLITLVALVFFNLASFAQLTVSFDVTELACHGDSTATIEADLNGSSPISFYISGWLESPDPDEVDFSSFDNFTETIIEDVPAGTYYFGAAEYPNIMAFFADPFSFTDFVIDSATVLNPDSLYVTLISDSVSCYESCNGAINTNVVG